MSPIFGRPISALALALSLAASAVWSDDAALYDEAVPADAVFVRMLSDYSGVQLPEPFSGAELSLGKAKPDTYVAISAADLGGASAGAYYSVIQEQGGVVVIEEPARETARKVHLIVVNTGPEDVRLVVPSQGLEVLARIAPGQAASQAVNPLEIDMAVERIRDGALLGTFDVRLSRGRNLTFVASASSARLIENVVSQVLTLK